MKATVAHINAASGRRVVLVVNIAVTPGTAAETAEALKGLKDFINDGVTLVLVEIVRVGQRLLARAAAPAAERPALGGLVRHVLSERGFNPDRAFDRHYRDGSMVVVFIPDLQPNGLVS